MLTALSALANESATSCTSLEKISLPKGSVAIVLVVYYAAGLVTVCDDRVYALGLRVLCRRESRVRGAVRPSAETFYPRRLKERVQHEAFRLQLGLWHSRPGFATGCDVRSLGPKGRGGETYQYLVGTRLKQPIKKRRLVCSVWRVVNCIFHHNGHHPAVSTGLRSISFNRSGSIQWWQPFSIAISPVNDGRVHVLSALRWIFWSVY
jgi:hypothetical protein